MADNDALDAALAQFNEGLKTQQAEEAAQRAVDKAERKKQQAASELKKLQSDANVSAEDKAAAEEAYRTAVEDFNKLRSGEAVEEEAAADDEPTEEEAAEEGAAEEEVAADDEPAGDEGAPEDESAADEPAEPEAASEG